MSRPIYPALDIAKLALAFAILGAHFANTWGHFPVWLDTAFSIYVIAVPFFFACSGFLLFAKLETAPATGRRAMIWRYSQRLIQMYLIWSMVYFIFVCIHWMQTGAAWTDILRYFHQVAVLTTYATIWFLPALLTGVLVVAGLRLWFGWRGVLLWAAGAYLLGTLGYSYSFLLTHWPPGQELLQRYLRVFLTTRNGLFNGFPWVALGGWMATRKTRWPPWASGPAVVVGLLFLVAEAFWLRIRWGVAGVDTALMLVPLIFFLLEFLLALPLAVRPIQIYLREMSTLVFLSQRLFISALPAVLPAMAPGLFHNSYVGLGGVVFLTSGLSACILYLARRWPVLRSFY